MTDLSTAPRLHATSPQLPVHWYFDPRIYELEQRLLFDRGPGYAGHELMVPEVGDYHVLEWAGGAKVLVRSESGVELLSNVCRHRQALMLKGRGNAQNIVCPVHRWTYALDGRLLGAPRFPENPCLDLARTPLRRWNGMLFAGSRDVARDLAALGASNGLDFSGHRLDRVEIDEYPCNWKTFIEVYLDNYHVETFHPGLGNFVDLAGMRLEFGDWYNAHRCGVKKGLAAPGTSTYRTWHDAVLRYRDGRQPPYGALWFTYYPNLMIECYPHSIVMSWVIPRGPEACANVIEYYYPEDIVLFEREFVEAGQAAYRETAVEDAEICERITAGRRSLYRQGISEAGPYQLPLEAGMQHLHQFLRRHLEPHL